jgi:hypothetical protein
MSSARTAREAQPDVKYEDVVFTNPFDIEAQALQKSVAATWGWPVADAFLAVVLIERSFAALAGIHKQYGVPLSASLGVIAGLDEDINSLVSAFYSATKFSEERKEAFGVALAEYRKANKTLSDKYFGSDADFVVQTNSPSVAPQN